MIEPIGFQLDSLRIDFTVEANQYTEVTKQLIIWTTSYEQPIYKSDKERFETNFFDVSLDLTPRTRYHVEVSLYDSDTLLCAKESFFETGKMSEPFEAEWIAHPDKSIQNTLFKKDVRVPSKVTNARLYATGLGIYETYINDDKVGDEYLSPGVTAYDQWVQVQTYDVTEAFQKSDQIKLSFSTGDGWYKGTLGFDGGKKNIYGDQQQVIAEYHLRYEDGSTEIISTDATWLTTSGKVTKSEIYYGEDLDDTIIPANWQPVIVSEKDKALLQDRLSLPVKSWNASLFKKFLRPLQMSKSLILVKITPAGSSFIIANRREQSLFSKWEKFYRKIIFIEKIYDKREPPLSILLTEKRNGCALTLPFTATAM